MWWWGLWRVKGSVWAQAGYLRTMDSSELLSAWVELSLPVFLVAYAFFFHFIVYFMYIGALPACISLHPMCAIHKEARREH